MQLTVKGKQIDVGDALRTHVREKLSDSVKKYFPDPIEATVTFSREAGHLYRADIAIHVGRGILLQAQYEADDPYPAFDMASERVAKRMRRYKDRLRNHHDKMGAAADGELELMARAYTLAAGEDDPESGDEPVIVAEMATPILTLTPGEAVMRMDLADLPALLFRNGSHGGLNMVYRRADGNIGWVDPEGNAKTVK